MSELNQEYENNNLPKEIWNKLLDNHNLATEVLEIPYIENVMNRSDQNKNLANLENVNQELPKPKIIRQSHIEDFFRKLNEQRQNESKDKSINLNESYEKMNLKISSFEKISEQHYKPKLENFSNIPHLPSPGVGGVKMNDFDDSQIQEFNHIGVIQLNAQSEVNNNFCLVNISTNFYTNINPMLIFPGDTHSFEHHSDAPST